MRPRLPIIHHLPRTGGTLISRCLAAFGGVSLLSEINPGGVPIFDPVDQATRWFGFSPSPALSRRHQGDSVVDFVMAIREIAAHAEASHSQLMIRDWTHLDFIGFPFNPHPTMRFRLQEVLAEQFSVSAVASVRNPADQYLSMRNIRVLNEHWDHHAVLLGMRRFAESIQGMPWIRFEDFVEDPDRELNKLCDAWTIKFDPAFRENWFKHTMVTGDLGAVQCSTFRTPAKKQVPAKLCQAFRRSEHFVRTCELLGYPVPEAR